jgi:hypothetical protein
MDEEDAYRRRLLIMARSTGPQKLDRVLRFLVALRDDDLAGPLVAAGLRDEDVAEGWALLRATAPPSVKESAAARTPNAVATDALIAWVRRHVPIVRPGIARRWPDVDAFLFGKLPPLDGRNEATLAAMELLTRLDKLALLAMRGLDERALAEAKELLDTMQTAPKRARARPDYAAAESAAWAWYLEWSAVARHVVRDGRVLRRLGFGGPHDAKPAEAAIDANPAQGRKRTGSA